MEAKIEMSVSVYEAAKQRIRYLFKEFEEVVVGFSGGKDSTALFYLTLEVAKELDRLPLTVMWIDQEGEWQSTVDFTTSIMERPDVKPLWLQCELEIENSASTSEEYIVCWDKSKEDLWLHKKHPLSIKENIYGTKNFYELFTNVFKVHYDGKKVCYLSGVRTEESPKRYVALTGQPTYKWITWGKILNKTSNQHYTFYPLYDWGVTDIWKYIHDNKIPYNKLYDLFYQHGVKVKDMRVSNIHHETAVQNLLLIQELEPETWNKVTARVQGSNTVKHLDKSAFSCPNELPNMFKSWREYAEYIIESLAPEHIEGGNEKRKNRNAKETFRHYINKYKDIFTEDRPNNLDKAFYRVIINAVLRGDWEAVVIKNFVMSPDVYAVIRFNNGIRIKEHLTVTKYFKPSEIQELLDYLDNKENI
jgi:predicted phosphoadenosine phosphosulfate sulfurtransferase